MKKRSKGKTVRICKQCGDKFIGVVNGSYCSDECRKAYSIVKARERGRLLSAERKIAEDKMRAGWPPVEDIKKWIGYIPDPRLARHAALFNVDFEFTNVYFLNCEQVDIVKIGCSRDTDKRFSDLRQYSPLPLSLLLIIHNVPPVYEELLHERFADTRKHGEWFALSDEIKSFIACTKKAIAELYSGTAFLQ